MKKLEQYINEIPYYARRLILIATVPAIGVFITTYQTWNIGPMEISHNGIPVSLVGMITGFMLWFRLMEQEKEFEIAFKWPTFLLAIVLFIIAAILFTRINPHLYATIVLLGTGISFFIFVRMKDLMRRALSNAKPSILAGITSSFGIIFHLLRELIWGKMVNVTAIVVHFLLKLAGVQTSIWSEVTGGMSIGLPGFSINIASGCSGLEGIFLFFFLLSAIFLLDWRIFSKWNLLELYGIGFIYMFIVNSLRITAFFLFAMHMHNKHPIAKDIVELFHSNIGLALYLITFTIFMTILYAIARNERSRNGGGKTGEF